MSGQDASLAFTGQLLTDTRADMTLAQSMFTFDSLLAMKAEHALFITQLKEMQTQLAKQGTTIASKLVEESFMRETIKGYISDLQILLTQAHDADVIALRNRFKDIADQTQAVADKVTKQNETSEQTEDLLKRF